MTPVLYRLPQVMDAKRTRKMIFVVEGEKDADALAAAGVVATCNPGGALKWRPAHTAYLAGAERVTIVADRDAIGRRHAKQLYDALRPVVENIVVKIAKEGKDASDHLAAGFGVQDFVRVTATQLDGPKAKSPAQAATGSAKAAECAAWALRRLYTDVPAGSIHNGRAAVAFDFAQQLRDVAEPVAREAMRIYVSQCGDLDSEGQPRPFTEQAAFDSLKSALENVPEGWTPGVFTKKKAGERAPRPQLDAQAFHGLPGKLVKAIAPHTEADPAALLLTAMAYFGNAIGPGPHTIADGAKHTARLFPLIVGDSSRARKGTSLTRISNVFRHADGYWMQYRTFSSVGSGEGLIAEVADPKKDDEDKEPRDKRAMFAIPEFAGLMAAKARQGATLSAVVRDAWDTGNLDNRVKTGPMRATGAHVSLLGHITCEEMEATLTTTDVANGFANRFLFCFAARSQLLPHGGDFTPEDEMRWGVKVMHALEFARDIAVVHKDNEARALWEDLYATMAEDVPGGIVGSLVSRSEAQVLRVALTYALWDGSPVIRRDHLEAAWAVWRYCRATITYLFGDEERRTGNPMADKVLAALERAPDNELTQTEISRSVFAGNAKAEEVAGVLRYLEKHGHVGSESRSSGGRPQTVWRLSTVS
ncbi:MAG TPA: hypothetical protein VHA73_14355 [Acidimicrobiales bacterium]|nr:hypothetical protein [Acidimicrobiales bacterium]